MMFDEVRLSDAERHFLLTALYAYMVDRYRGRDVPTEIRRVTKALEGTDKVVIVRSAA